MIYPGFVNGSFQVQSLTQDQERTVNWFYERSESQGATSPTALYPTPGIDPIVLATVTGNGRAHFYMDGREFAVIGVDFVEITQAGGIISRGAVTLGPDPATISSNGDGGGELFITSASRGYIFDLTTNVLNLIVAIDGKATMGDALDGYFLALDAATSTLYISDLLDGQTWDPTQFAQRSSAPDPWLAMNVVGKNIWLLGEQTSSVWYNAGTFPFPFAEHPSGSVIPYGIAAPFSHAEADGTLIWLAATRTGHCMVVRASGFTPEVISTFPVQWAIERYGTISDAFGDTFNYMGHTFYKLSFPTENVASWMYDIQSSMWTEIGTWISEDSAYIPWRARFHALAFGEHRMLDSQTGHLYRIGPEFGLDVDSRPIRRLRRAPALMDENRPIRYPGFEVDLEPGLGLSVGQGSDPQVMWRFSNDGGKTWSIETMMSAGKIGQYYKRVRANRCGSGRRRVFEISVSDPTPFRIANAFLTPDPVTSGKRQQSAA